MTTLRKCYCGEWFIRTPSGWCCPKPHGKLFLASPDDDIADRVDEIEQREGTKPVVEFRGEVLASLRSALLLLPDSDVDADSTLFKTLGWHTDALLAFVDAVDGLIGSLAEAELKQEATP